MSKTFNIRWEWRRKPSIPDDRIYSNDKVPEERKKGFNDQNYAKVLVQIDKHEVLCFVCKTFLKRVKPEGIEVSDLANIHPWEVLYECKNGHVLSGETVVYLYLNYDFRIQ